MDNIVLEKIKMFAIQELQNEYGYCGAADAPNIAILNAEDSNGEDIKITITTGNK